MLAPSTASSRMPKYVSSSTEISPATTKHTIARMSAPVPRTVSGHRRLIAGSLPWGDRNAHGCGDALENGGDGVRGASRPRAARRPGGDQPVHEHRGQERGQIIRDDEAPPVECGPHLRGPYELQGRAGARAEPQVGVRTGRV